MEKVLKGVDGFLYEIKTEESKLIIEYTDNEQSVNYEVYVSKNKNLIYMLSNNTDFYVISKNKLIEILLAQNAQYASFIKAGLAVFSG